MSNFISDPEASALIMQFGIVDDEISDDHLTVTSKLGNGETLIQHREPRQYEYTGTLPDESTAQAPVVSVSDPAVVAEAPQAPNEPVAPAAALDAQGNAQEPVNDPAPADPSTPSVEAQDANQQQNATPPLDPAAPAAS